MGPAKGAVLFKNIFYFFSGDSFNFSAELATHQLYFLVTAASTSYNQEAGVPLDTFTLQLPRISANGAFKVPLLTDSKDDGWNLPHRCRHDGYYDITIYMGMQEKL